MLGLCREQRIAHEVRDVSLTEVFRADEMFCTGTMGELATVSEVDGRTIGSGKSGHMTERLSQLFRELTGREGTAVVDGIS